ncbi:hypothetical protein GCM10020229_24780 [Kitasatospora albolonga]|uniref:hypothetical protein n=1 Tax=Kitasatospora albolonga TaxID=68173 RepID=UPI0031EE7F6B
MRAVRLLGALAAGLPGRFTTLFVLAGLGNGSTYKMIPVIFEAEAQTGSPSSACHRARPPPGHRPPDVRAAVG